MNGITEPLPGLLDDPQFAITDLPALTDFHIAPLRDPAPLKHTNVPSPLEPVTANAINPSRNSASAPHRDGLQDPKRIPYITPTDVLLARESKKPHLAISELLEDADGPPQQLPSFISLSVVERSPIQQPSRLDQQPAHKRIRLEQDGEINTHDVGRQLPRPAQKDLPLSRPAPLLPAMVTGLHEPPPSAALLPSMDLDEKPAVFRTSSSKIQVKDILRHVSSRSPSPTAFTRPAAASNTYPKDNATLDFDLTMRPPQSESSPPSSSEAGPQTTSKDPKIRRTRRKWTFAETQDLLAGVYKHGIGKWKQILDDPAFNFTERSSVDLKDRFRVCSKDESVLSLTPTPTTTALDSAWKPSAAGEPRSPTSSDSQPALQQLGPGKQRRKRRAWTDAEDAALLTGVAKHGFQWTAIHDDIELGLAHRRATDLRDRIRNKFPDGYRHAESAPLRSEVKKAQKEESRNASSGDWSKVFATGEDGVMVKERSPPRNLNGAMNTINDFGHNLIDRGGADKHRDAEKEKEPEKAGVTLPSLTLDDDDMDWNTRLPPLLPWDEIG